MTAPAGAGAGKRLRWYRPLAFGLTMLILIAAAAVAIASYGAFARAGMLGIDLDTYRAFAQRWLDTGSMYLPWQMAAPFDPQPLPHVPDRMPSMYPPTAVLLFAPFLVLPAVLWYAIPLGVIAYALWRWRPAPWAWPLLALVLVYPPTVPSVISGNTTPWIVAAICGGLVWGWPSLLVMLKPSLLPLAFIGIRRRSWWLAAGVGLAVSALFAPEWVSYIAVVRNEDTSLAYSLGGWPVYVAPFIGWLGRERVGGRRVSCR